MHRTMTIKHNLRAFMENQNMNTTAAAELTGVSKQYLSQYLNDFQGTRRDILLDELSLVLEISPTRLQDDEPFPPQPGAIPPRPAPVVPFPSVQTSQLLPRLLSLYEAEDYHQLLAEYQGVPPGGLENISVRDQAEIELLAAKSLIHTHHYSQGIDLLYKDLKLFQQRQSQQPQVFIPYIIDCFRYLALAEYLQGNTSKSLAFHQRLLRKVQGMELDQLNGALMEKVRSSLINALTLAKQTGDCALAVKLYTDSRDFFLRHSDRAGVKWLEQEAALSQAKVAHLFPEVSAARFSATFTEGIDNAFVRDRLWRRQCYNALGRQDFTALANLTSTPPSRQPRTNLFRQYLVTLIQTFAGPKAEAWRELNTLQHYYYGGNVLNTDYYLIAHALAEAALAQGYKQAALHHMLDALCCTRAAGDWEERLRLLDRLAHMPLDNYKEEIVALKIDSARTWLKKYWEGIQCL